MKNSLMARIGFVGLLAAILTVGWVQLGSTAPAAAGETCVCPAVLFPGCTYTGEYTWESGGRTNKCCVYSCGAEYCGIDGPGNC